MEEVAAKKKEISEIEELLYLCPKCLYVTNKDYNICKHCGAKIEF